MNKSYFARYHGTNGVSIARHSPKFFTGPEYKDLAPSAFLLKAYKENEDQELYTRIYYETVLNRLDPKKVYDDLKDKTILCYERPEAFCHRHLVAKWIYDSLGIIVHEI